MSNKIQSIASKSIHFLGSLQDRYVYMSVFVVGFVLYFKSLFFDFTYFDDNVLILQNIYFLTDPANIFTAFQMEVFHVLHAGAAYYRPLLTISFMPDAMIGGIGPFMYHFTNIAIHLVASCLLYLLLKTLKYSKVFGIFASLIFVAHPVLTQAVSWIPGRNDSLLAVFILPAFIYFLKFVENKKTKHLILTIIFFALAIFTKESALVFVPICLLYYFLICTTQVMKSINLSLWSFWLHPESDHILDSGQARVTYLSSPMIKLLAGWGIVIATWAILRNQALANPIKMTASDMILSVWNNLPALPQMIGKIFFPFNLSVLPIIQDTTFVWGFIAILVIVATIYLAIKKTSSNYRLGEAMSDVAKPRITTSLSWIITHDRRLLMMSFGLTWFIAFLLPSFIRPNPTVIADFIEHRVYIPMIGIIIFIAEVISTLSHRPKAVSSGYLLPLDTGVRGYDSMHYLLFYFLIILLFVFSGITFAHQDLFADRLTFWASAAETSPHSPLANRNLGAMLYLDGDMDGAEVYYEKSLELNENEEMVHNNLGLIYMARGEYQKAEGAYLKELIVNPYYDNAHYNLGLLYYKLGKTDEARKLWQKTLEINPDYEDAKRALEATKGI